MTEKSEVTAMNLMAFWETLSKESFFVYTELKGEKAQGRITQLTFMRVK